MSKPSNRVTSPATAGSLIPAQWEGVLEELRVAYRRIAALEAENKALKNLAQHNEQMRADVLPY